MSFPQAANGGFIIFEDIEFTNSTSKEVNLIASFTDRAARFVRCSFDGGDAASSLYINQSNSDTVVEFVDSEINYDGGYYAITLEGQGSSSGILLSNTNITGTGKMLLEDKDFSGTATISGGKFAQEAGAIGLYMKSALSSWSITGLRATIPDGGSLLYFDDGIGDHWADNPDNHVFERNVYWGDPSASTFNSVFWQANSWYPGLSNYCVDPDSVDAALVVAGTKLTKSLTEAVGAVGDSIANGAVATSGNMWFDVFKDMAKVEVSRTGYATTIPGLRTIGALPAIDRLFTLHAPQKVFIFVGINDMGPEAEADFAEVGMTAQMLANRLEAVGQRVEYWGAEPIFLSPLSQKGGNGSTTPPPNTKLDSYLPYFRGMCGDNGWFFADLNEKIKENSDWYKPAANGGYWEDIVNDVHPNNDGHAIIGEWAVYRWLDTNPICAPLVARPLELRPVRCMPPRS